MKLKKKNAQIWQEGFLRSHDVVRQKIQQSNIFAELKWEHIFHISPNGNLAGKRELPREEKPQL